MTFAATPASQLRGARRNVPRTHGECRYHRLVRLVGYHHTRWAHLKRDDPQNRLGLSSWYWQRLARLQRAMDRAISCADECAPDSR